MISALPAVLLLLSGKPALAATMGPTDQTLEALRGSAIDTPDRFFDGMDQRVTVLTPSSFIALPKVPDAAPSDTGFDSRVIAPGVTVHRPLPRRDPRAANADRSTGTEMLFILGAALVAVAVLLVLFL